MGRGQNRRLELMKNMSETDVSLVADLADMLVVSKMTVHRDLDILEEKRLVRKVRGGAVLIPSTIFEAEYAYRKHQNVKLKSCIAEAMISLVKPGMVVYLDDSSTIAQLVPFLQEVGQLAVVTNSLPLHLSLKDAPNLDLLALGGKYDKVAEAFFGLICNQAIERLQFDLAFFSCSAVKDNHVYQNGAEIVETKRRAMASANGTVLALEASKFSMNGMHLMAPLTTYDYIYIANDIDTKLSTELTNSGVDFTLVNLE